MDYIQIYNILGSIICTVALAASLAYYRTTEPVYLRMTGFCQVFFLMEIANICSRKSNSRYIPTVIQLVSRNFIMWVVFWYYNIINGAFPIITICWCLSDLVRYLFYTFRTNTIRFIRYNLFLITCPVEFLLEMYCLCILYSVSGRVTSYAVASIAAIYISGFVFLFSHMIKQRQWSKRAKVQRKKEA